MRVVVALLMAMSCALGWSQPAAATDESDVLVAQVLDVRPFRSAHFGLAGTVKLDGITIDILGEGDLALPDRQRAAYKFGPLTVELVLVGDAVYTRTRFDRSWSREIVPAQFPLGSIGSIQTADLQRDVRLIGREQVDNVVAEHYTANLNVQPLVEPLLPPSSDPELRRALESLRGSIDVWVGAQDRMTRQERLILAITLPAIEPEGEPLDATVDLTVAYSRLNEAVSIEAPSRSDPSPLRTPRPDIVPISGPPGSPTRAPVQIPRR